MSTIPDNELGMLIARSHYDEQGGIESVEVLQADELVAFSRELLDSADPRFIVVDGDLLTICGEYVYRATGDRTRHDDPVYRREALPDDEEFCPTCFAGMESDQHFRACVVPDRERAEAPDA